MLTASEHKQEAAALCKLFTEDDIQDLVNPVLGRMPSTRSALERLQPTAGDADKAFINELLNADLGVLPQWRKDPQKLWTIYNDMLTQVLSTEDPHHSAHGRSTVRGRSRHECLIRTHKVDSLCAH